MGSTGLWSVIEEVGEVKNIAAWSSEHYGKTGRPLRIAVDEQCWRYANLTEAQIKQIKQDSCGTAHPIENAILSWLFRFMVLNIQFIFVFDSYERHKLRCFPERTWLLKTLLDHLHVPWYEAPYHVEAECAKLNEIGVVDAVWTSNAKASMLGAKVLVKFHKPTGSWNYSMEEVLVYKIEELESKMGMNRKSIVLFGVLTGCHGLHGLDGLDGCEEAMALSLAARDPHGLAERIWDAGLAELPEDLRDWRGCLQRESGLSVPPNFPPMYRVRDCVQPLASNEQTLRDLPCLKNGWFWSYGSDLSATWFFLCRIFNPGVAKSWPLEHLVAIEANHLLQSGQYRNTGQIKLKLERQETGSRTVMIRASEILTDLRRVADYWKLTSSGNLEGISYVEFSQKIDPTTDWAWRDLDRLFEETRHNLWPKLQDIEVSATLLEGVLDRATSSAQNPSMKSPSGSNTSGKGSLTQAKPQQKMSSPPPLLTQAKSERKMSIGPPPLLTQAKSERTMSFSLPPPLTQEKPERTMSSRPLPSALTENLHRPIIKLRATAFEPIIKEEATAFGPIIKEEATAFRPIIKEEATAFRPIIKEEATAFRPTIKREATALAETSVNKRPRHITDGTSDIRNESVKTSGPSQLATATTSVRRQGTNTAFFENDEIIDLTGE